MQILDILGFVICQCLYFGSWTEMMIYLLNPSLLTLSLFFSFSSFFFFPFYFNWRLITLQYCGGFCHIFTWISHGYTCVPHPEPPSHLPFHPLPQGHPSAPALSTLSHASNLDWQSISHMVIYMFQCYPLFNFLSSWLICLGMFLLGFILGLSVLPGLRWLFPFPC